MYSSWAYHIDTIINFLALMTDWRTSCRGKCQRFWNVYGHHGGEKVKLRFRKVYGQYRNPNLKSPSPVWFGTMMFMEDVKILSPAWSQRLILFVVLKEEVWSNPAFQLSNNWRLKTGSLRSKSWSMNVLGWLIQHPPELI